ncbi:ABC-type polar amino acid transport system ATPase subunit [Streptacidiphilus sp. MAP12-33]
MVSTLRGEAHHTLGPLRVHRVPRARAEQQTLELLDRLGLAAKAKEYPDRLTGQQQRVALVRAIDSEPRVLLLNQITAALDPELVTEVLSVVRGLKEQGRTMVLATHETAFAQDVADQVCFLADGVILERGTFRTGLRRPQHERTRRILSRFREAGRL